MLWQNNTPIRLRLTYEASWNKYIPDDNDPDVYHEDNHGGDDLEVDYIDAEHSR